MSKVKGISLRIIIVGGLLFLITLAHAHEPIIGLGPHTIYKDGIGTEVEIENRYSSTLFKGDRETSNIEDQTSSTIVTRLEINYGLTTDLTLSAELPYLFRSLKSAGEERSTRGVGDIWLRVKYRFWRRDIPGEQDALAFVLGTKLPTGDDNGDIPLGTGSTDYLFAFTGGIEDRRWYFFSDIIYRYNIEANGRHEGNTFFYDIAGGIRPDLTGYYETDIVFLVELNGEILNKDKEEGIINRDSGGHVIGITPGVLVSYRNYMIKTGRKSSIYQDLNGVQLGEDYSWVLGIDVHW